MKDFFGMTKRVYCAERAFSAPKAHARNVLQKAHQCPEAHTSATALVLQDFKIWKQNKAFRL
jgi:hypothetical protein